VEHRGQSSRKRALESVAAQRVSGEICFRVNTHSRYRSRFLLNWRKCRQTCSNRKYCLIYPQISR
jgi:hypothetical protein